MTRRQTRRRAWIALALAACPGVALADRYYVGPANGNWNTSANWSATPGGPGGAGVPDLDAFTYLRHNDAIDRNILLNVSTPVLGRLRIGNTSTGLTTLTQSSNFSISSTAEFLGSNSINFNSSGVHTQSAGLNTITWLLSLGDDAGGGTGTYNLSGTGSMILNASAASPPAGTIAGLFVGNNENGVFNQNGGTVTLGSNATAVPMFVGYNGNGVGLGTGAGTYNLNAGSLTVNGEERIGVHGSGTFVQSGGRHALGKISTVVHNLTVGSFTGSTGYYELDAGTLAVSSEEYIGLSGAGSFLQTGGSNEISDIMLVTAGDPASTGTYQMDGGSVIAVNGEIVGGGGAATFKPDRREQQHWSIRHRLFGGRTSGRRHLPVEWNRLAQLAD